MLRPDELIDAISRALLADAAAHRRTAIVLVGLDDRLPETAVNELLARLCSTARDDDLVGRADERHLLVVARGMREVDGLAQLVVRVTATLRAPVEVLGQIHAAPMSIGGVLSTTRSTPGALLAAARRAAGPHPEARTA